MPQHAATKDTHQVSTSRPTKAGSEAKEAAKAYFKHTPSGIEQELDRIERNVRMRRNDTCSDKIDAAIVHWMPNTRSTRSQGTKYLKQVNLHWHTMAIISQAMEDQTLKYQGHQERQKEVLDKQKEILDEQKEILDRQRVIMQKLDQVDKKYEALANVIRHFKKTEKETTPAQYDPVIRIKSNFDEGI